MLSCFVLLAFGSRSSAPGPTAQSLCRPGSSTTEWLSEALTKQGPEEIAAGLLIGARTTICRAGEEEQGQLLWVLFESLELGPEGQVLKRRDLLERGAEPRYAPGSVRRSFQLDEHALQVTIVLEP